MEKERKDGWLLSKKGADTHRVQAEYALRLEDLEHEVECLKEREKSHLEMIRKLSEQLEKIQSCLFCNDVSKG